MLFLTSTDSLEAVLDTATTTTVKCLVSYIDTSNDTPGNTATTINGTTDTTILAAPSGGQRLVKSINIYNGHSVAVAITIQLDVSGTEAILFKCDLSPGETLYYSPETGWVVQPTHSATIPACRVYMTGGGQVVSTGGGGEILEFNAESYDTDGMHDNSTENTKVFINTDGKYRITGVIFFGGGAGTYRYIQILHNGSSIAGEQFTQNAANGYALGFPICTSYQCSVGDYIQLKAEHDKGSDLTMGDGEGGTHLCVERFSA